MGGFDVFKILEEGVEIVLWLGIYEKGGFNGKFFRDKDVVDW